jgi:hypothetical protein
MSLNLWDNGGSSDNFLKLSLTFFAGLESPGEGVYMTASRVILRVWAWGPPEWSKDDVEELGT